MEASFPTNEEIGQTVALKEWASAIMAFRRGETILALRKGGIREETRDFQLKSDSFYFLPAYEHQKPHLVKERYRHYVEQSKADWNPERPVVFISARAEVAEDILIYDADALKAVSHLHIWTDAYAEERLRWKRTKPLHGLLLRVYNLREPIPVEVTPAFAGCKSWVDLRMPPPSGSAGFPGETPALPDDRFAQAVQAVKSALENR